jgi:hypothetical protein
MDAAQAMEGLGVSRSRLYALRTKYLLAKAGGTLKGWMPGLSGGDHAIDAPAPVEAFLRDAMREGYSYAFAASEALRLFGHSTTRSGVRRWALSEGLARKERPARTPAHTRRWQRTHIGELWQLDATPHEWFGPGHPHQPLFDMIDDASRLQVGIRLCLSENVMDYADFFRASFEAYGIPLEVYVDCATFFRSPVDGALTMLGRRLAFYGVSLRFATTPQAKGKVERIHQVWQDRLPHFFRLNGLARHRNAHEIHREIGMRPKEAWDAALAEGRSKLRSVPDDGWWPYVWSLWRNAVVGARGRVYHKDLFFPTRLPPGERVVLCEHASGHYSVIKSLPAPNTHPVVLFTNLPKPAD